METGDLSHGNGDGKAIAAAGREEVERGLSKIEGKHARTSAATDAPNGSGPHDGTGAAPVRDPNAPQASAAAPRADISAGKARGDAPELDTSGYTGLAGKETGTGTASAAKGAVGGPGTDLRANAQIAAPAAPPARDDRPTDADDPNVQHDTGVELVTAPGDPRKQSRPSTNLPLSDETGGGWINAPTSNSELTHHWHQVIVPPHDQRMGQTFNMTPVYPGRPLAILANKPAPPRIFHCLARRVASQRSSLPERQPRWNSAVSAPQTPALGKMTEDAEFSVIIHDGIRHLL